MTMRCYYCLYSTLENNPVLGLRVVPSTVCVVMIIIAAIHKFISVCRPPPIASILGGFQPTTLNHVLRIVGCRSPIFLDIIYNRLQILLDATADCFEFFANNKGIQLEW